MGKKRAVRFFIEQGQLFRRSLDGTPHRCLAGNEIAAVLKGAHEPEHQGGTKLYQHLLHLGYYWPTMEDYSISFVRRCQACQKHGNLIHAPAVDLHSLRTPWPFHTWALDLIGPISPFFLGNAKGCQWILAATE